MMRVRDSEKMPRYTSWDVYDPLELSFEIFNQLMKYIKRNDKLIFES